MGFLFPDEVNGFWEHGGKLTIIKKRRRLPPDQGAERVVGSFYSKIPEPQRQTCSRCGVERINVDKSGVCCYCQFPPRIRSVRASASI